MKPEGLHATPSAGGTAEVGQAPEREANPAAAVAEEEVASAVAEVALGV